GRPTSVLLLPPTAVPGPRKAACDSIKVQRGIFTFFDLLTADMALRKETRSVIVREKDGEFILVKQHDHSQLAGRIAAHWRHRPEPYESTLLAIREHDLGWQLLDESVRLNPTTGRPYSFMDLPMEERLPAYTWGIDQVEKIDPYAACLCSRHYVSRLRPYENEHPLVRSFVAKEQ